VPERIRVSEQAFGFIYLFIIIFFSIHVAFIQIGRNWSQRAPQKDGGGVQDELYGRIPGVGIIFDMSAQEKNGEFKLMTFVLLGVISTD
jgi:hypothetical protein